MTQKWSKKVNLYLVNCYENCMEISKSSTSSVSNILKYSTWVNVKYMNEWPCSWAWNGQPAPKHKQELCLYSPKVFLDAFMEAFHPLFFIQYFGFKKILITLLKECEQKLEPTLTCSVYSLWSVGGLCRDKGLFSSPLRSGQEKASLLWAAWGRGEGRWIAPVCPRLPQC